jgi:hypothetical protein
MALDNGHSANDKPEPFTLHDDAYFAAATARSKIQGLRDIGILMNSRRTASLNAIRGIASACIDEDDSGTYDPKESRSKTTIFQPRRMKKAKRADGDEDPSQELGTRRGTQAEYSLPITAPFSSPQGLDYSRSISPDPFDDGASNPDGMRTESPHFDNGILITRRQYKKPTRLSDEDRYARLCLKTFYGS